jgi:mono/diheme cytochrome c family protein
MTRGTRVGILILVVAALCAVAAGFIMVRRGFSAREQPSWIESALATTMRNMAIPATAKRMKNPVENTPETLMEAEAHWADHCASCHANNGSGETEMGRNLYPKAPDMRLNPTQALSDGELYYTIKNGIRLTGMPAWGEPGDADQESWKLVHFIRHLPKFTAEEEKRMESLNPKSPQEMQEEQEEQEFLTGGEPSRMSKPHKH